MTERSTADESTATATLGHKAARGFAYAGVMFASERLLIFIATLVLARLLLPDDFGLVAFSLAVLNYVEVLADAGLGEALVQRTDAEDDVVSSTAFWIGLAGAVGLVALTWLAAPLVARFGSEQAVAVIRVLSLDFVLAALGKVHEYRLRHSLDFDGLVVPAVAGAVATGVVGIGAAFAGAGAWSLVAGLLAGTLVRTISLWILFPWRPRLQVSSALVPSFVKFGSGIVAVGLLGELAKNFDYLVVGARLGTTALGFYYLAFRLPELAVLGVMQVANEVLFPFYARTRDASPGAAPGGQDFGDRYLATVRLAAAVVVPASVGMAALASPIVLALYGPEWHAAVVPMALVACWTSLASLAAMPGAVFKAIGRTWLLTATGVAQLVVLLPLVWLAAGHGIAAVAGAQLIEKVISLAMLGVVTAHILPVPWYASFRAMVGPVLMSAVMAALVYPIGRVLDPVAALAVGIPVGCGCYLFLLRVFMPDIFRTSTAPLGTALGATYRALHTGGELISMSACLQIDKDAFRHAFGTRSVEVHHELLDEPLLETLALEALADRLPAQWVRRERGDLALDHRGAYVEVGEGPPSVSLQQLEVGGLRVSLREIQQDPAYVQLIDTCLDQVEACVGDIEGGMRRRSGYVFVTAPDATTPMHIDPEHSMLLQVRGRKRVFVAGLLDPAVLRREVVCYFDGEPCDFDVLREGSDEFLLTPGTGVYFPSFVPHWVETEGTDVSVSFSIVFYTQFSRRAELVHKLNKRMRKVGLRPRPPGASERADRLKALVSESWMKVKGSPPLPGPAA